MKTIFLVAAACAVAVSGCSRSSPGGEEGSAPKATVAVDIISLSRGTVATVVEATGRTQALRKQKAVAPFAGRIIHLNAIEGTRLTKGMVILSIRPKESQAAMMGAESMMRDAATEAERIEARRSLALAESSQTVVQIRAGIGGTVASRNVSEGDDVAEGAELVTLVDLQTMAFVADVPLDVVRAVHPGQQCVVRLTGGGGRVIPAIVEAINPQTDGVSQSVGVRARFVRLSSSEKAFLKADEGGTISIVTGQHRNVFVVPRAALLRNDESNTTSVKVMASDSLACTIAVTPGILTDSTAEISGAGLQEGMKIVVRGNYALEDSTKLNPVLQGGQ